MLIDSWAWIEYFRASPNGQKVREALSNSEIYTSVLSLAEIADWCVRNHLEPQNYIPAVLHYSSMLQIDEQTAEAAGRLVSRLRKISAGIGMVDTILYTQALENKMNILTGDPHFKKLEHVLFIE